MDFSTRYSSLNKSQKEAVDTIEGPLMVVAGPGTGKTELLSVRTANILRQTDTLPENILCLTFTDSGAAAMRERLTGIIGKDAYKVAVHTFHSFGSEVINQNGKFFYQGANFRASDQLSTYEILKSIFDSLDYNSPIASKQNNEYTYLGDAATVISELKKSGLTSDELLNILDANDIVIQKAERQLSPIFAARTSKQTANDLLQNTEIILSTDHPVEIPGIVSLAKVLTDSLRNACEEAIESNSTKPVTAWRNKWFKKDSTGTFVMKASERQQKLRALSYVYQQYLIRMQEAELYDFDDMILTVVHAMEVFDELRFNLQEKYQYIMVDEFQDTNLAQMRIIHNLTNNEVQGDTPNIMVVGDDDQAIYSFQGADISNILNFTSLYPKAKQVTLIDNYRSDDKILAKSREVIIQGSDRLESRIPEINKQLIAHYNPVSSAFSINEAESAADERAWLVREIKKQINSGTSPGSIAVLTRRHYEIVALLPYFSAEGISISYERRDNVLELEPILLIEKIAHVLLAIADGLHDVVNGLLPELLAHPAWNIKPSSLWRLSLDAYDSHSRWLELMQKSSEFSPLYDWFIATAFLTKSLPLEQILDIIIGKQDTQVIADDESSDLEQDDAFAEPSQIKQLYSSPFYEYFFSTQARDANADLYLTYLEALRTIRTKLKEYRPTEVPTLESFIEFITLHRQLGSTISSIRKSAETADAVNVMTAHKSKGLEFETVYIINSVDTLWGERARSRGRLIGYPENLQLAPAGENSDERLRLFYVAMTRAKSDLKISYSLSDDKGKNTLRAGFLISENWQHETIAHDPTILEAIETAELAWYEPIIEPKTADLSALLKTTLSQYKLSVTHLYNFLDVTRGGPNTFLLHNLLRFPQAISPNAAYGSAIHSALQRAHAHLIAHGERQATEDVIKNFESSLEEKHLNQFEYDDFLAKGSDSLLAFLTDNYASFNLNQKPELNFNGQHSLIGEAHLTGSLDLVEIDNDKNIIVTDYKTGKPSQSWVGKTEYEKIKLYKYKQQLIFYKLLVENSRDYRSYKVEKGILQFVEPDRLGSIHKLEVLFTCDEINRVKQLIEAVWKRIISLNLPDISNYDKSLKGIIQFENDLINDIE